MKYTASLTALLCCLPLAAHSNEASNLFSVTKPNTYKYQAVELNYVKIDGDVSNALTGFEVRGFYDLRPNLALYGGYQSTKDDINAFSGNIFNPVAVNVDVTYNV